MTKTIRKNNLNVLIIFINLVCKNWACSCRYRLAALTTPTPYHQPQPRPSQSASRQRKSADCQVPFKVTNLNNRWSYSFLVTLQFFLPHNILCHKVFRNQKLLGAENLPELKNLSGAKIPLGPKFLNFMGISILRPFMPHACKATRNVEFFLQL